MEEDPELAAQWRSLAQLPANTLDAAVWQQSQIHSFTTPGELGGANAALAHHDWLHILGGYKVDVIGEVENAAFGAGSSSVPGSTLWFLGAMAMFEKWFVISFFLADCHPHPQPPITLAWLYVFFPCLFTDGLNEYIHFTI